MRAWKALESKQSGFRSFSPSNFWIGKFLEGGRAIWMWESWPPLIDRFPTMREWERRWEHESDRVFIALFVCDFWIFGITFWWFWSHWNRFWLFAPSSSNQKQSITKHSFVNFFRVQNFYDLPVLPDKRFSISVKNVRSNRGLWSLLFLVNAPLKSLCRGGGK